MLRIDVCFLYKLRVGHDFRHCEPVMSKQSFEGCGKFIIFSYPDSTCAAIFSIIGCGGCRISLRNRIAVFYEFEHGFRRIANGIHPIVKRIILILRLLYPRHIRYDKQRRYKQPYDSPKNLNWRVHSTLWRACMTGIWAAARCLRKYNHIRCISI